MKTARGPERTVLQAEPDRSERQDLTELLDCPILSEEDFR
jgi:hypothetical protein